MEALDLSVRLRVIFRNDHRIYAKCVHVAAKNLDVHCGTLSVRIIAVKRKFLCQYSKRVDHTAVAVAFIVSIAFVNFENQSVIVTMYSFPRLVFGRGSKMSMTTNSNGSAPRNNRSFCCCLFGGYSRMVWSPWRFCRYCQPYGADSTGCAWCCTYTFLQSSLPI